MAVPAGQKEQCFVCRQSGKDFIRGAKDYFVFDGKSADFEIRYCAACAIGYSLPRMTAWELRHYYPENYEAYVPKYFFAAFLQKLKYGSDLKFLRRFFDKKSRTLFEIGAGRGEFLSEAKKNGFDVSGLEPSPVAVRFAMDNYKINLRAGFAEDIFFTKTYDGVIARHVLEHVENPQACLVKIFKEGLKEGGVLFLKLPRLDSWEAKFFGKYWHGFDLPRHRVHFSRAGIRKMLAAAGFKDIRVRSEIVPTDILRSLRNYARHGKFVTLRFLAALITLVPGQMMVAQFFGILFSFMGPGRMVVTARK